jgi:hypothetical protein
LKKLVTRISFQAMHRPEGDKLDFTLHKNKYSHNTSDVFFLLRLEDIFIINIYAVSLFA